MLSRLPPALREILLQIAERASKLDFGLYLVGGCVRDLLLGRTPPDLDLVVEGDAIRLARLLEEVGERAIVHPQFGTASLTIRGIRVDLSTARAEFYPHPASLPQVTPSDILQDLRRRDFTINAMALSIRPQEGRILDPFEGRRDLERGIIRVLHERSFIDDPTRIFRAIRYEQRFGFRIEEETLNLILRDRGGIKLLSGERIFKELDLFLKEPSPERCFRRAWELGILWEIMPFLWADEELERRFEEASAQDISSPSIRLLLFLHPLSEAQISALRERLRFPGKLFELARSYMRLKRKAEMLGSPLPRSELYHLLRGESEEAIRALFVSHPSPSLRENIKLYLEELRHIKPFLSGDDLKRMGIPEGRRMGEILKLILEARIEGRIRNREEEEEFVRRLQER